MGLVFYTIGLVWHWMGLYLFVETTPLRTVNPNLRWTMQDSLRTISVHPRKPGTQPRSDMNRGTPCSSNFRSPSFMRKKLDTLRLTHRKWVEWKAWPLSFGRPCSEDPTAARCARNTKTGDVLPSGADPARPGGSGAHIQQTPGAERFNVPRRKGLANHPDAPEGCLLASPA